MKNRTVFLTPEQLQRRWFGIPAVRQFAGLRSYHIMEVQTQRECQAIAKYANLHKWTTVTWKDDGSFKIMKVRLNKCCPHCRRKI